MVAFVTLGYVACYIDESLIGKLGSFRRKRLLRFGASPFGVEGISDAMLRRFCGGMLRLFSRAVMSGCLSRVCLAVLEHSS